MLITVFPMNYFGAQHVGKSHIMWTWKQSQVEKWKLQGISRLPLAVLQFFCFFLNSLQPEDVCVCVCVCACGLKNGFQRYLGPNPWKLSIHSYGHRDFTDVTKLRILRWGDHPKFSLYALNVIRNDLTRGRKREI
jgi:hypothetical protein